MEEQGSFELDKYQMVNGEAQYLGQTMLQKNVKVIKLLLDFDSTSSCVALRAADLGLSGQDGGGGGAGISKNVTHAGSQLSFEMFRYEWRPVSITPNPTDVCCEEG